MSDGTTLPFPVGDPDPSDLVPLGSGPPDPGPPDSGSRGSGSPDSGFPDPGAPIPGSGSGDPAARGFAADAPTGTSPEVTRLLCLGAYLDGVFRRTVLNRLVVENLRVVAPSYGFDAVPVVAHCMRADRIDEEFRGRLASARILFIVVLMVVALLVVLGWTDSANSGRTSAWAVVLVVLAVLAFCARIGVHFLPGDTGRDAVERAREVDSHVFPWLVRRAHLDHVKRVLAEELSEETFTGGRPADDVTAEQEVALRTIAREQYSALIPYRIGDPFLGAGVELNTWSLALELRKRGAERADPGHPLDERAVIDLIRPRLESLTLSAAGHSRDRLGGLEISECVFLPGALPYGALRSRLPVGGADDARVADHLRAAVGEGGEQRRHFLRIRVAGWDEQVVVTVFVRVHTQGGVLLLEIIPYLLGPLDDRFQVMDLLVDALTSGVDVDHLVKERLERDTGVRGAVDALLLTRRATGSGIASDDWVRRVRGPVFSLREHAHDLELSHFQRMDIVRYVKTLGTRIAEGVNRALEQAGYETDEFRQQIVNLGEGAVFIDGSMNGGAIATGRGSSAQDRSSRGGSGA
ncbi:MULTISPECIES: hypothetical protein [unclassified Nocardiopsis]|uniref:hypothetical protein n=1 Tax=Nocardiopsis TaxID=2013 RepID=UPI00387B03A8